MKSSQLIEAQAEEIEKLRERIRRLEGVRFCGPFTGPHGEVPLMNDDAGPTKSSFHLDRNETLGSAVAKLDQRYTPNPLATGNAR